MTRDFPEPVFIGGSQRAGTHAMGELIAAHPRYHLMEIETRFQSSSGGLPDLLAGRVDMARFLERCRGHWWKRPAIQHEGRGLCLIMGRDELDAALEEFEAAYAADPWGASRRLVRRLLDPVAERHGKPAWVDVTGGNIRSGATLLELFPRARLINMVRDGRAVAAAMLNRQDMTDDPMQALRTWERRVRQSHAAIASLPERSAMVVHLDDLAALDREPTYRRLVEFLEIEDDGPMRHHFDTKVSAAAANVGRWRERMPPPEARRFDRQYRRLVRRLHREGVWWVPAPRDAPAGLARLRGSALTR